MVFNDLLLADSGIGALIFLLIVLFQIIASIVNKKKKERKSVEEGESMPLWKETWFEEEEAIESAPPPLPQIHSTPDQSMEESVGGYTSQPEPVQNVGTVLQQMLSELQQKQTYSPPLRPSVVTKVETQPKSGLKLNAALSSVEDVSRAIILAEILGPCKAKRHLSGRVQRHTI